MIPRNESFKIFTLQSTYTILRCNKLCSPAKGISRIVKANEAFVPSTFCNEDGRISGRKMLIILPVFEGIECILDTQIRCTKPACPCNRVYSNSPHISLASNKSRCP